MKNKKSGVKDTKVIVDTKPVESEVTNESKVKAEETVNSKKSFSMPKIAVRKDVLIKIGVTVVIILVLVPLLDWLIQTSISSKYAAFYKGHDVTRQEYMDALQEKYGTTVMQNLLAKAAIQQLADEKKVTVSTKEVDDAIANDKKQAGITTDAQFQTALTQAGITEKTYRESVQLSLTLDKLTDADVKEPTEDEMKKYFADNSTLYTGKKFEDVKDTIKSAMISATKSSKQEELISTALSNYDKNDMLIKGQNDTYKFMRSVDLLKRLFAKK